MFDCCFVSSQGFGLSHSLCCCSLQCRYEFLEAIVRLAKAKFLYTPGVDTHAQAVTKLLMDCVLPRAKRDHLGGDAFRQGQMYCEGVDMALKQHARGLKRLYDTYSGAFDLPGEPRRMQFLEFRRMVEECGM